MKVGEKVQAEWEGSWYPAVILKAEPGRYFLHWEGYGDDWDGWVEEKRIRQTAPFAGLTISHNGSRWAELEANGRLRVDGSYTGEFTLPEGTVRRDGSIKGCVEPDGTIRIDGSISGEIEENGTLRRDGSVVGEITADGTIYKGGSVWGEVEPGGAGFDSLRAAAAVLVFFAPDFGG